MKLALYLPNFRNKVTVKELEDLTSLAEELDFDSVWTLDRIVVPEASDRVELQHSFGMMPEFPKALLVSGRSGKEEWFPLSAGYWCCSPGHALAVFPGARERLSDQRSEFVVR